MRIEQKCTETLEFIATDEKGLFENEDVLYRHGC